MKINDRATRNTALILLLILIIGAAVTYFVAAPGGYFDREQADIRISAQSSKAAYTTLDGEPIDLSDLQGKLLVINVWASWSPYSATELPILSRLQVEFGDRITIVAMNRNETIETVKAYRSTISDTASLRFIQDTHDFFFNSIGGYAMPETLFYDTTGNIVKRIRGTMTEEEFRQQINHLLEQEKD